MREEGGFTIVEVLVSLVLLATVLAIIPSAIRLANRQAQSAGHMMADAQEATGLNLLADRLAQSLPVFETGEDGSLKLAFEGSDSELRFVATSVAGGQGTGMFGHRISQLDGALVLRVDAFPADADHASIGTNRPLVQGVTRLKLSYFGWSDEERKMAWMPTWLQADRLPQLVRIAILREGTYRALNEIVVYLRMSRMQARPARGTF